MRPQGNVESSRFADLLERSFHGGAWHGPSLREALDGIDAVAARQRVGGSHSIAEIVGHLTFWIDAGWRRIEGGHPPEAEGSDWPTDDPQSPAAWTETLARLESAHRKLHARVAALDDERLDDPVPGSDPTVRGLLAGLLEHNAYHAGQIVLLARAAKAGSR
jgi:uncharacterized damage-inducible protein DinB